jgi:hypothetical protein
MYLLLLEERRMFFSLYSAEGILIPMVDPVDARRAEVQAPSKATSLAWTWRRIPNTSNQYFQSCMRPFANDVGNYFDTNKHVTHIIYEFIYFIYTLFIYIYDQMFWAAIVNSGNNLMLSSVLGGMTTLSLSMSTSMPGTDIDSFYVIQFALLFDKY